MSTTPPEGFDCDVLVVGAGPVGLTLAMDLAARGARVQVAEVRRYAEPPNVKCNHVSARSMEVFRRLGVAHKLRNAGLPEDFPNDVVFRTSVTGQDITRIPIPCRRDRYTDTTGPDGWWPTPEPPLLPPQPASDRAATQAAKGRNLRVWRTAILERRRRTQGHAADGGCDPSAAPLAWVHSCAPLARKLCVAAFRRLCPVTECEAAV